MVLSKTKRKGLAGAAALLLAASLTACGGEKDKDDDEKENSSTGCGDGAECEPGDGYVTKFTADSVELSFPGARAGSQYAIIPFSLGNAEGAPDEAQNVTFKFNATQTAGGALKLYEKIKKDDAAMDVDVYDHTLRMLAARFDRRKGHAQGEAFWRLTKRLDSVAEIHVKTGFGLDRIIPQGGIEDGYRKAADKAEFMALAETAPGANLTQGNCPTDEVIVPNAQFEPTPLAIDDPSQVVDKGSYCLIYLEDPVTEDDKAKIEASLDTILETFKSIYGDEFEQTAEGYSFIPQIVILDFADDEQWPPIEGLQVAGAYLPDMVNPSDGGSGRPMIYMPMDLNVVKNFEEVPEEDAKIRWHATLAHEMQHAIMDYYTRTTGAVLETVAVDEGFAHYMEDAFGYGEEIFPNFAKSFLDGFPYNLRPLLTASNEVSEGDRGAAHALVYYLSARKGGVTFKGGRPAGGGGLEWAVSAVKNRSATSKKGALGLANAFGGDWTQTFGEYVGALALDGRNLGQGVEVAKAFSTGEPVSGVKDLTGKNDKTFGMRFNGYLDTADWTQADDIGLKDVPEEGLELNLYSTRPVLYTVSDPEAKVTITASSTTNSAVTVVRLK